MSVSKNKWDIVFLGNIAIISAGGDKPKIFTNSKTTDTPIPVIANAINNDGIIGYTNKPIIENNSITISARGTIGYSSIRNYPYYPIVRLISIIPDDNIVDISYLKYIFDILYEKGVGTSIPQLTIPMITNKQIPLPPLDEQKRLVKIIETKLKAAEKAKKASDEQKIIIIDFLSSFVQNLIYNKDWDTYNLGDVCLFSGGSQPPKSTFSYQPKKNYIRLVQIQDFRKDDTAVYIPKETARRTFTKDNVMIGRYGPPVFQILRGLDGAYNVALMKAEPLDNNVLDNNFLFYLLQEKKIQNAVINQSQRSAGQSGVDKLFLEKQIVNIPDLNTQKSIVEKIEKYKQKSIALQAYINEQSSYIKALPSSILRKAFNGDY